MAYDFGMVGLGVMGRNFILNVADSGFSSMGLDLSEESVNALKKEGGNTDQVDATTDTKEFVQALTSPRKIMLLVPAGKAVDAVIKSLLPHLDKGDLLIDGGNSFYKDTDRREAELNAEGIHYLGVGVSGGAKGARLGPSIMPGGSAEAYEFIRPIFEAVAADAADGEPCVAFLGPRSAGNYVKMVHNGIEYGMMQLTGEIYDILRKSADFSNDELHKIFSRWNDGRLQSFLVKITSEIFLQDDEHGDGRLIDKILDKAKQKGTGKWTSQNAMDIGIPVPTIDIAVSMREISALKEDRVKADAVYDRPAVKAISKEEIVDLAERALYFGFINAYTQGLHQLAEASAEYEYDLDLATIAKIWRAGCIIRAELLEDIMEAFQNDPGITNLMMAPAFITKVNGTVGAARRLVSYAVESAIPAPGLANSLTYFDAFTASELPLNLIQAQRDYFGSHTYERNDMEGVFHTEWEKN